MPKITYHSRVVIPQPKADYDDDEDDWYDEADDLSGVRDLTVVCSDPALVNTGLLDADGNPIMKLIENDPIGYIWHR